MGAEFTPQFIFEGELKKYGLPSVSEQDDIISLVQAASILIDEYTGRRDMDNNGSLVWTTYHERKTLGTNRNVLRLSFRPLVALDVTTVSAYAASGANQDGIYTGFQASTVFKNGTTDLSPIVTCSGRYGYGRRSDSYNYPGPNYGGNILQISSNFGGPPAWGPVPIELVDVNTQSAEIWIPAGLYITNYTEIDVTYTSGYDPFKMPSAIKQATAQVVKNSMLRGGGATGLKGIQNAGRIGLQFMDELIDPTTARLLMSYMTVIAD